MKSTGVSVIGAAESDLGMSPPDTTPVDLMAQATVRAAVDAGISISDIDGVFATTSQLRMAPLALSEYLGIHPKYFDGTNIGGSSFMSHLAHAVEALKAGLCTTALIAYGSTQRSVSRAAASPREPNFYETPYRPLLPVSAYALAAARHMHLYGTTRQQLAEIAVAARTWAAMNPKAWSRDPLTVEEILAARLISSPLTKFDCCLVTDGGGALILTTKDRAADVSGKAVSVLGYGEHLSHQSISKMAELTVTGAVVSGKAAYEMAGLSAEDVDVAILYDAFTICTLMFLEDLGFCAKGEGGAFVADGGIAPRGRLPVNTNGGGLSYCHPGMYGMLGMIEAVQQLRGACGERQVDQPKIALAHGNGGVLSSQCTVLFGNEQ